MPVDERAISRVPGIREMIDINNKNNSIILSIRVILLAHVDKY
jgi:hypothetical protein